MRDGEPRAQRGAMAAIEGEQFLERPVAQQAFHAALDRRPDPARAEPLTFKAEKCDLVERIDSAQPRVEFETVDEVTLSSSQMCSGRRSPWPVDDAPMANSRGNKIAALVRKTGAAPGRSGARGPPESRIAGRAARAD